MYKSEEQTRWCTWNKRNLSVRKRSNSKLKSAFTNMPINNDIHPTAFRCMQTMRVLLRGNKKIRLQNQHNSLQLTLNTRNFKITQVWHLTYQAFYWIYQSRRKEWWEWVTNKYVKNLTFPLSTVLIIPYEKWTHRHDGLKAEFIGGVKNSANTTRHTTCSHGRSIKVLCFTREKIHSFRWQIHAVVISAAIVTDGILSIKDTLSDVFTKSTTDWLFSRR